jgi:hypothetical protein
MNDIIIFTPRCNLGFRQTGMSRIAGEMNPLAIEYKTT